jgi:hypothetical protein
MRGPVLRQARSDDVPAVAAIWREGWADGHVGHVPTGLVAIRTPESFVTRAPMTVSCTAARTAATISCWQMRTPASASAPVAAVSSADPNFLVQPSDDRTSAYASRRETGGSREEVSWFRLAGGE